MRNILVTVILLILISCKPSSKKVNQELPILKISENQRFLMDENGNPFFWLGDTGWLLFSKLSREEAGKYLENRRKLGFNVVQVMVLHDLKLTNFYKDSALIAGDVSNPKITTGKSPKNNLEYDYWDHVDYIVDLARDNGIYMAMVPVWGTNIKKGNISRTEADAYSKWLINRFNDKKNIIWLNGGDILGSDSTQTWKIIGENLHKNTCGQLVTFHPFGRQKSSTWFHKADWLDFNMIQSGHRRYDQDDSYLAYGQDNWKYIRDDYALNPVKPTLDGEPSYEAIPQGLHDTLQPLWNAADIRRYAYWSVFAGGFGFTYGHNAVMQMHKPNDKKPSYGVKENWETALNAEGATQMKYIKDLILSKPFMERIPDSTLIASEKGEKYNYLAASRGNDYALIYTFNGLEMNINMGKIKGDKVRAEWFDPRTGNRMEIGIFENKGRQLFNPPGEISDGNDWVLILDSI